MTKVSSGSLKTKVDDKCFSDFWGKSSLPRNLPKMQSGAFKTSAVPNDRLFEAMGSFRNRGILLIADAQINLIKARVTLFPFTSCIVLTSYVSPRSGRESTLLTPTRSIRCRTMLPVLMKMLARQWALS